MTATIHTLRVHHFQSLHDVSLELKPFTVIVGASSSGKSALVRAIKTLVSNRRGTEWITHGQRIASITATTDQGTVTLTRSRSTASNDNAYTLTPANDPEGLRTYTKLGGEVPEDVSRFLGIDPKSPTIFAGQFDKPYLLDDSTSEVARVLGSLTNVSVIFDGARESNRRKLQASATLKLRSQDLEEIKARVPEFQALKRQDQALVRAEELITAARLTERKIARLTEALTIIETTEPLIPRLTEMANLRVPDESRVLEAADALRSFQQRLALIPTYGKAVEAAESAYRAVEAEESALLDRYAKLTGEITSDLRGFFDRSVDPLYTVKVDGQTMVEAGHAVGIFLRFLEMKSGG